LLWAAEVWQRKIEVAFGISVVDIDIAAVDIAVGQE
jgi:hypothetical protein